MLKYSLKFNKFRNLLLLKIHTLWYYRKDIDHKSYISRQKITKSSFWGSHNLVDAHFLYIEIFLLNLLHRIEVL